MRLNIQRLRGFVPLRGLVDDSLRLIAKHSRAFRLRKNDVLFEIGDTSPYSYFLLEGDLESRTAENSVSILNADIDQALYPIGNLIPRQVTVKVISETAVLTRIERNIVDKEIAWGQAELGKAVICEFSGLPQENQEWMLMLLHSPTFFKLPMSNVQILFQRFQESSYTRGEVVVKEGDPGEKYFIIRSGICRVSRKAQGREIILNTLKAPEGFGEQALISDQPRTATVTMETPGIIMSLAKKDFVALMQAPLQKHISLRHAMKLVETDRGRLIDVRSVSEYDLGHIPGSRNIPIYLMYLKREVFVPTRTYVVYCDSGARSEAAAFLLTQRGLKAYVLENAAEALAKFS